MYIRKTKTRVINAVDHFAYRMVESRRDATGKVKQHTLLNLGAHYDLIPEADHSILSQRVENIITGQLYLLPLSGKLETEAQRIANLIIKKHAKPLSIDDKKIDARYEHVDITSIENTDDEQLGSKLPSFKRVLTARYIFQQHPFA